MPSKDAAENKKIEKICGLATDHLGQFFPKFKHLRTPFGISTSSAPPLPITSESINSQAVEPYYD
jgi:hypothetical protein